MKSCLKQDYAVPYPTQHYLVSIFRLQSLSDLKSTILVLLLLKLSTDQNPHKIKPLWVRSTNQGPDYYEEDYM